MAKRWTAAILLVMLLMTFLPFGFTESAGRGSVSIFMSWNPGDEVDVYLQTGQKIVMSMYRIAQKGAEGDQDWRVLPVYAELTEQILEIENDLRAGKEEAHKIDPVLEKIHTMIQEAEITPITTSTMDEDGGTRFSGLSDGIYYTEVTQGPPELLVQSPLLPIPFTYLGAVTYSIVTKPKITEVTTPTVTTAPPATPTPTPTETPPGVTEEVTPTPVPPQEDEPEVTPEPTATALPTPTPRPSEAHPWHLYIRYIYEDGEEAFPPYDDTYWEGDPYYRPSPTLDGYYVTLPLVEGVMPDHDMYYTVIYIPRRAGYTVIDDYDTPLGLGHIIMHVGVCYE